MAETPLTSTGQWDQVHHFDTRREAAGFRNIYRMLGSPLERNRRPSQPAPGIDRISERPSRFADTRIHLAFLHIGCCLILINRFI
jgi:hypothetical protein